LNFIDEHEGMLKMRKFPLIRLNQGNTIPAIAKTIVVNGVNLRVVVDNHDGRRTIVQTGLGDGSLVNVSGDASGKAEFSHEFLVQGSRTLWSFRPVFVFRALVMCQHHLRSVFLDHADGIIDVVLGRILLRHAEAQDVFAHHACWYHVQSTRGIDVGQQLLIHLVALF